MCTGGDGKKPVCLICGFCVSVVKKYNLERHYISNHADLDVKYPAGSELRREFVVRKTTALSSQKAFFTKQSDLSRSLVVASYEMALLLAKKKKPFTDGEEILKPALQIAARMLGDKQVETKFKDIPLSNNTMTRRVEDLAEDVQEQVAFHASNCKFFSLAMDESTDLSDTAQVTIFVRAVSDNFDVIEELLGLESLEGTTKGSDLFSALKTCVQKSNLDWAKLDSICSDGCPSMTGKHCGCLALLERFLERQLFQYHCIIYQEALCGKSLQLKHVMDSVTKCVNKIRARALNRREFRQFLLDMEEDYGELILHCEVRWLSKGKVLSRFWDLKNRVLEFLTEIDELPAERKCLEDADWQNDLAFLVDITSHLNVLNVQLQGSNKLFTNMCNSVASFEMRLQLFATQLSQGNLDNFDHLKGRSIENSVDTLLYQNKIEALLRIFQTRFNQFKAEEDNVALFSNPFTFPNDKIGVLQKDLQLELIDLKCNIVLKGRFAELPPVPCAADIISFWKLLPTTEFGNLRSFAQRYMSRFGSTYRCEQTFSAMKLIKN